jgi:diketogulonate reductase-like aldo/keto reductase
MIEITRQGASMPALGMGTWQMRGEGAVAAVRQAIDLGYRHIDTAQMYGNEAEVGRALAGCGVPRDELWVTTKIDNDNHTFERVKASVEESLAKLKTDYVDLLLIHWPVFACAPGRDARCHGRTALRRQGAPPGRVQLLGRPDRRGGR